MDGCNVMIINDDLQSRMNHHRKLRQTCVILINTWGLGFC